MTRNQTAALTAVAIVASLTAMPAAHAAPVPGQGTWQTTLQARDLDGNGVTDAFYDTVLNITWLRDANANRAADLNGYAQYFGEQFGGVMSWDQANTWAKYLTFGGYSDWRLPTMVDTGEPGCWYSLGNPNIFSGGGDCVYNVLTTTTTGIVTTVYSEMASLYYDTLGNRPYCTLGNSTCSVQPVGWGLTNTGDFVNLQAHDYWVGLEDALALDYSAWTFNYYYGGQDPEYKAVELFAMAVRPGDVTAASVPEPGTVLLVIVALAGLGVVRRRWAVGALRL